jgi:CHAT domain-containing protein/tetratricopeptide (TPR) repeat protein
VDYAQEPKLEPGQTVARDIAGGESHMYQIALQTGQFARFRIAQEWIDVALTLTAPDGKQLFQADQTGVGEPESFSLEAAAPGSYRLTVRGSGPAAFHGSYRLEATVQATATAQDRKQLAAEALGIDAAALANQMPGTAPRVIEKLEQALPIWRELGSQFWTAWALNRIGRAYISLGQNDKAIPLFEQALVLNQELKNRFGEGVVLNSLANAYYNLRQYERGVEYFEKNLTLYREVKYRRWEGLTLYSLGNSYNSSALNQPDKATGYYEQALAIVREVKDRSFEAQALNSLGAVAFYRGQMDKAIANYEAAIAIFRELNDRSREAQTSTNMASVYNRLGQTPKAIEILNQDLTIFRELKDRFQESSTLIVLGNSYGSLGQTEKAIDYFEQALAVSREIKNKRLEIFCLNNLGMANYFLSRYEKSIEYLEQSLPISRELKVRASEGQTLSNLGSSYRGLGQFEKAIEVHEQALAIFRETKQRTEEGNSLQNLGIVYKFLGDDDKAVEYLNQSLAVFREVKYRVGEGNVLSNIGDSYERLGRLEDANNAHEQALAIYRELKYRPGEGSALTSLGVVNARLNHFDKALEFYEQALAIHREVKSPEFEGQTLFRMGESKLNLGRPQEAVDLFIQSVAISHAIGDKSLEFHVLTAYAKAERERGNLAQALSIVEESLQITEKLRADLVSSELRASFLAAVQDTYQLYVDLLMRLNLAEPGKALDARAVEASERRRARSLLDLLTESRTDLKQGVDPVLITRARALSKQLNDKARQLTQADKGKADALKLEVSQLETEFERAQTAIRKASPHYAALTQPQPLKLKEIQQQLDADTLLLEYDLGGERSYLWAITKDSLASYELPREELIGQNARQVYGLLQARVMVRRRETASQQRQRIARADTQLAAASRALSQLVLAPVASQLGGKRLVVVADGALQYVPFAMLPEPEAGRRGDGMTGRRGDETAIRSPLIVNHEIISLPSASALAVQRAELADRRPAPRILAVIADPVFERDDPRLTKAASESGDKVLAQARSLNDERSLAHLTQKSAASANATARKLVIPRLPFTRQEATRLLALAPRNETFGALDFQANRLTAMSAELSQYQYVHFATHGVLDSERPGLSSLLLSMVDAQGNPQDGFLRANDIYNLKLPAELVVLSACQTGLGKEIKGEGLVGLTRGFMYAGAARVVVSLWNVNDQATADLMAKFYQRMLKQGERPAAALRAAQVEMWRSAQWRSPYYWAAFTMEGEWR